MMKVIIEGTIPSTTANRKNVRNPKTGAMMNIRSAECRSYEKDFQEQALDIMNDNPHFKDYYNRKDRVDTTLVVYDKERRKDIDSYPKTVYDNCQKAGFIVNDNRIDDMRIVRRIDKTKPRAEIFFRKLVEGYVSQTQIIVCSNCGSIISRLTHQVGMFDIWDCSWSCPVCCKMWLSSDGWEEIGHLLIPYREEFYKK